MSREAIDVSVSKRKTLREIFRIALPAVVSNISVPLLSLVDTAITGHLGSAVYIGAIAVGGMVFNVLYWLMGFLRMGTSGLTAQAFGRGDGMGLSLQLARGLLLAAAIGLAFVAAAPLIGPAALKLVGCQPDVEQNALVYFRVGILGAPAVFGIYVFSGWFIGMQNSVWPMVVAIAQNVANIAMSLAFVYGLGMKVEGVAAGTVVGEYVGLGIFVAIYALHYSRRLPRPNFRRIANRTALLHFFGINRDIFLRSLMLVAVMSWFTVSGARSGAVVLAANALLMQLFVIFSYVNDGLAYAAEAISGKTIGAGNRAEFVVMVRLTMIIGGVAAIGFAAVYAAGGRGFLALLTNDVPTIAEAMHFLPFAVMIPLMSVGAFLMDGVFVGATASRQMLASAGVSATVFFGLWIVLSPSMGNYGLWTAFIGYLAARSGVMLLLYPGVRRRAFVENVK